MTQSPTPSFACRKFAARTLASAKSRSIAQLAIALILCGICSSEVFGVQPAELVAGIVSRSKAVASGRITYTFKSESFVGERALRPVSVPETTTSFSDSSWAERSKSSHLVQINHDGYFLEFVRTPQRDGSVRPGAILYPQRALESRKELNAPPLFAGSFWQRGQLRYIEKHAGEFRVTGSSTVNAIPVVALELAVAAENYRDAFQIVLPALKSGGTIRLYVAPQLGFVLPRVEFLTPSRQVAQSYDSVDFTEVAPGIHFPQRLWTQTHAAGGSARYRAEFTTRCEFINQPVPEEDFIVELPLGTRVQDAREPGDVIKFELTEPSTSSMLPSLTSASESGLSGRFMDRWRNAVIVGFLIGTVASISFLLAGRNERYRSESSTSVASAFRRA
jgi:hypothetical protein